MWLHWIVSRFLRGPAPDVARDMANLEVLPTVEPAQGRASLFGAHIAVNREDCPVTYLARPEVPDTVRLDHGVMRQRMPDAVYTKDPALSRSLLQNRIHPRPRRWARFNQRVFAYSVPRDLIGHADANDPMVTTLRAAYIQGLAGAFDRHGEEIRSHVARWVDRVARGRVEVTRATRHLTADIFHLLIFGRLPPDPLFSFAYQFVGPVVRDPRKRLAHVLWPLLDRLPTPYAAGHAILGYMAGLVTRVLYLRYRHREHSLMSQLHRQGLSEGHPAFGWQALAVLLTGAAIPPFPMLMMLVELAERPDLQQRIVNEDLYAAVVKETLRLHPPVVTPGRVVMERTEGDSATLEPMTSADGCVFVNIKGIHRHPRGWVRPDEFVIDRWLPGWTEEVEPAYHAYLPFGLGARSCVSAAVTPKILEIFLRAILSTRVISNPTQDRPRIASGAVAMARYPLRLEFAERTGTPPPRV